jgi:hypothetical protein
MQSSVATLLLVTAAVMLVCVVINYSVSVMEQSLSPKNSALLDPARNLAAKLQNQTDQFVNSVQPELQSQPAP